MMTARFLHGEALSAKIKEVCKGANGKFAVAFWGNGAANDLFGGKAPADAKIICDISMGGTNPDELEKLGAPNNENLKYIDGLHAKVYLSDNGAVIGSANASENGVGFRPSGPGHSEAGVFLDKEHDSKLSAEDWFNKQWRDALQVDQQALNTATERWKSRSPFCGEARERARQVITDLPIGKSLLRQLIDNPDIFDGVGFLLSDFAASDDELKQANAAFEQSKPTDDQNTRELSFFVDDEDRNLAEQFTKIIFYDHIAGDNLVIFYEKLCHVKIDDDQECYFGVDSSEYISTIFKLEELITPTCVWRNDRKFTKSILSNIEGGAGQRHKLFSRDDFIAALGALSI